MVKKKKAVRKKDATPTPPPNRERGGRGRYASEFTTPDPNRLWTNPRTGQVEVAPPVLDWVSMFYGEKERWEMVAEAKEIYGCSPTTIDRAIAMVKASFAEIIRANPSEQFARVLARADLIYRKARSSPRTLGVARQANMDQARLLELLAKLPADKTSNRPEDMTDEQLENLLRAKVQSKPGRKGRG